MTDEPETPASPTPPQPHLFLCYQVAATALEAAARQMRIEGLGAVMMLASADESPHVMAVEALCRQLRSLAETGRATPWPQPDLPWPLMQRRRGDRYGPKRQARDAGGGH